jgi:iron complex transport system substrate-binding protein
MTLDDAYAQMEQLGVLTGHVAEAAGVVADTKAKIEQILAEVPESEEPLSYYYELDDTYFSATSNTLFGQILSLAGLQNIADHAEAASDYPQLNAEFIVSQDPDIIYLADAECCDITPQVVAARDGWSRIAAVAHGNVVPLQDDIASRWGPRMVDLTRSIVDSIKKAAAVPAG